MWTSFNYTKDQKKKSPLTTLEIITLTILTHSLAYFSL